MKKTSLLLLITGALLVLFTGCPKENTEADMPAELTIYTNPTDGTLFSIEMDDGRNIKYYGEKDFEGMPTILKTVAVNYGDGEGDYVIDIDNSTTPKSVLAPNGTVFQFEPTSETSVRIKAISPDGSIQVSVPFDMTSTETSINTVSSDPVNIREGMETVFNVRELDFQPLSVNKAGSMSFNVIQCDQPVKNAYVIMSTNPPIGTGDYIASGDGAGNYNTNVPQSNQPEAPYEKECDEIGKIINNFCNKYGWAKMLVT